MGFQIIVLLVIAVILVIRLINTLGTRDGFEQKPEIVARTSPNEKQDDVIDDDDEEVLNAIAEDDAEMADALREARAIEPGFHVNEFLNGSKRAYEMILMAFLNGDVDAVEPFVDDAVMSGFRGAIEERNKNGQTIQANFEGIRNVELMGASFDQDTKELLLDVEYTADITRVIMDRSGDVIDGDKNKIETEIDRWQFARVMGSADPNWTLVGTGA